MTTCLKQILASGHVEYQNDLNFINDMVEKVPAGANLSQGKLKYLRDIIFKYDPTIMQLFTSVPVTKSDIDWAQEQIRRFEARGVHRYRGVDAYKGVAGERVISRYMKRSFPYIKLNTPIGEGNDLDEFDFSIGGITCDIKCSTVLHYASITPKITVENETPKDYYIGARFDDRDPNNNLVYIIGYLTHKEIVRYKKLQKFGTPYYEVSLLDMNDLNHLMKIIRMHNTQTII